MWCDLHWGHRFISNYFSQFSALRKAGIRFYQRYCINLYFLVFKPTCFCAMSYYPLTQYHYQSGTLSSSYTQFIFNTDNLHLFVTVLFCFQISFQSGFVYILMSHSFIHYFVPIKIPYKQHTCFFPKCIFNTSKHSDCYYNCYM